VNSSTKGLIFMKFFLYFKPEEKNIIIAKDGIYNSIRILENEVLFLPMEIVNTDGYICIPLELLLKVELTPVNRMIKLPFKKGIYKKKKILKNYFLYFHKYEGFYFFQKKIRIFEKSQSKVQRYGSLINSDGKVEKGYVIVPIDKSLVKIPLDLLYSAGLVSKKCLKTISCQYRTRPLKQAEKKDIYKWLDREKGEETFSQEEKKRLLKYKEI
jgi:hypothetical protein